MLGGEVAVPTMDGAVTLTVPPETQNGRRFRLRGKGMPRLRQPAEHGDLFSTMSVVLPTHLSVHERELFKQLRTARPQG